MDIRGRRSIFALGLLQHAMIAMRLLWFLLSVMHSPRFIGKICLLIFIARLCQWILSYLRNRPQRVRIDDHLLSLRETRIGALQGCVLSPVLFTMYTDDHRSDTESMSIIKYADDTALLGLLRPGKEAEYMRSISHFVQQCNADELRLNVRKTKEMIIDFRKTTTDTTH